MVDKSLCVVGCGWLGFPLSRFMLEKGWKVHGSTMNKTKFPQLWDAGIVPYLLKLPDMGFMDFGMFSTDYLVINIPPGRKNPNVLEDYPNSIEQLLRMAKQVKSIKKIVFVSSTSVYGNVTALITEKEVPRPKTLSGQAILAAEQLVKQSEIPYVILRFGGLAGPKRHPGNFLAGLELPSSGDHPVNYLHLKDAIGAIAYMLEHPVENEVFNVVAPDHPTKKEFYAKMAMSIGLSPPTFTQSHGQSGKEISADYLLNRTNFEFQCPDPMQFVY